MSPTARSLAFLRAVGWTADVVERWIGPAKVRKDWCGIADIICFDARQTLLVQCTTGDHLADREQKVRMWPGLTDWLLGGRRVMIHGWSKKGERGKRKTWQVSEREVKLG